MYADCSRSLQCLNFSLALACPSTALQNVVTVWGREPLLVWTSALVDALLPRGILDSCELSFLFFQRAPWGKRRRWKGLMLYECDWGKGVCVVLGEQHTPPNIILWAARRSSALYGGVRRRGHGVVLGGDYLRQQPFLYQRLRSTSRRHTPPNITASLVARASDQHHQSSRTLRQILRLRSLLAPPINISKTHSAKYYGFACCERLRSIITRAAALSAKYYGVAHCQ
jgi:hypothetical protein